MSKSMDTEADSATDIQDSQAPAVTKRSLEFTSENYKLEISNLPPKQDYHLIRHLLEHQLKLQTHKIRIGYGRAFVAFSSAAARDEAINIINNREWKGQVLVAQVAAARDDPFAKRAKTIPPKELETASGDEEEPETIDLNARVCPLWGKPYEDQLRIKETSMRQILNFNKPIRKFCHNLEKESPPLHAWLLQNSKIACDFQGVEPSPTLIGYRNKCEFNVGRDNTVGFRVGRYKVGCEKVEFPPEDCPLLNQEMFQILKVFQEFLDHKTTLKGFDHATHDGHIRQLTIRTNREKHCLVILDLHPQDLSDDDLNKEIDSLKSSLKSLESVKSIYINNSSKNHLSSLDETIKLVYGDEYLHETLLVHPESPLKFRIGPASFFQVNTRASEILYKSMIDMSGLGPNSLVLDVGCGIGTISLSVAKSVAHVIGIEIVKSAVEDAKKNAADNGIKNVSFFAGKAEDLITECIDILKNHRKCPESEIVAIVDPPRQGFNNSFIKHIRASNIRKLIYIACDPRANTNLTTLCRPTSKAYRGEPFVPIRAKAFDMFPQTKFCELLIVYERLSLKPV